MVMSPSLIALNRLGLGVRPIDTPPDDAPRWIELQMSAYQPALPGAEMLASRNDILADLKAYRAAQRAQRERAPSQTPAPQPPAAAAPPTIAAPTPASMAATMPVQPPAPTPPPEPRTIVRDQHILQAARRIRSAVATDTPFVERLVHFWANHFAISADKQEIVGLGGLMEFEAIRPHVLGRFEDMLVAVETHPAMLLYLDQAQSIGPDSMVGARANRNGRKVGLNENLAREIMELHTLGVRSGYTQADVTEFARAITGWTVTGFGRGPAANADRPGDFAYVDALHQPGKRVILNTTYRQDGQAQGRAILTDLARHPATARHISTKLARHFVADDPPPALVERLTKAYLSSNGDLTTVYRALIAAKETWRPAPAKFRDPWGWSIAVYRALDLGHGDTFAKVPDRNLVGALVELGQPIWRPGSPAGYDDIAASWAAPDALLRRVELANRITGQAPATVDARNLAARLLGDALSPATAKAIANAESPRQGLALLLVSPEMLRV